MDTTTCIITYNFAGEEWTEICFAVFDMNVLLDLDWQCPGGDDDQSGGDNDNDDSDDGPSTC